MEEKIRLRIIALEDAISRSSSKALRKDYGKQVKKLKAMLKQIKAEKKGSREAGNSFSAKV